MNSRVHPIVYLAWRVETDDPGGGLDRTAKSTMIIHQADRPVVKWAVDRGYPHEYLREYGLPDPSLRVQLGLSSAFFEAGRLIHWRANVDGRHLDQLMFELTLLFDLCARIEAYPPQTMLLSSQELTSLQRPSSESA